MYFLRLVRAVKMLGYHRDSWLKFPAAVLIIVSEHGVRLRREARRPKSCCCGRTSAPSSVGPMCVESTGHSEAARCAKDPAITCLSAALTPELGLYPAGQHVQGVAGPPQGPRRPRGGLSCTPAGLQDCPPASSPRRSVDVRRWTHSRAHSHPVGGHAQRTSPWKRSTHVISEDTCPFLLFTLWLSL